MGYGGSGRSSCRGGGDMVVLLRVPLWVPLKGSCAGSFKGSFMGSHMGTLRTLNDGNYGMFLLIMGHAGFISSSLTQNPKTLNPQTLNSWLPTKPQRAGTLEQSQLVLGWFPRHTSAAGACRGDDGKYGMFLMMGNAVSIPSTKRKKKNKPPIPETLNVLRKETLNPKP